MSAETDPYATWPEHIIVRPYGMERRDTLRAWIDPDAGWLFMHVSASAMDLVVSKAVVYVVDRAVEEFMAISPNKRARCFIDWLDVDALPPEGRRYQQEKSRTNLGESGVRVETTFMAVDVNPLMRMAITVLTMLTSLSTGAKVQILPRRADLLEAFAESGFEPPARTPIEATKVARLARNIDFITTDPNGG